MSTVKIIIIVILLVLLGGVGWLLYQSGVLGKPSLQTIKSRADQRTNYEATVTVGGVINQVARAGQKVKATTTLAPNLEIYQDFAADKVYFFNPQTSSFLELDQPSKQVAYADLYSDYDLAAKAVKTESVAGVRALKFELKDQNGNPVTLWANPKTGLPVKVIINDATVTLSYQNFGQVNEASVTLPSGAKKAASAAEFAEAVSKLQAPIQPSQPAGEASTGEFEEELGTVE